MTYVYQPPVATPVPNLAANATLPALRALKDLADCRPTIVVDSREQAPLVFCRLKSIVGSLVTGDYAIQGAEEAACIERKSVCDVVACTVADNRDRFERELMRMGAYPFSRLLIVGDRKDIEEHRYRSNVSPRSVLNSLSAWEVRYSVPVLWVPTPEAAALQVESWLFWVAREITQRANNLLKGCEELP